MKLISSNENGYTFAFRPRDREMLAAILHLYPLLNPDYHQISKPGAPKEIRESEQMLRDSMNEQREKNRKAVAEFLGDDNWADTPEGHLQVTLNHEKMEWLLQVLNDVRVGSWVMLGEPDSQETNVKLSISNLPYAGALELSGYFQMVLLQAMGR